jgi:hypothetical protein
LKTFEGEHCQGFALAHWQFESHDSPIPFLGEVHIVDTLTDPLYGLLIGFVVAIAGFFLWMQLDNKWGILLIVLGLFWVWLVAGKAGWMPAPPFSPIQ